MLSRFSHVWLFVILWTVALQAPLSMGFSRQEYWGGMPCPPPGDLPNPGIEPMSLMSPALTDMFFTISVAWEAPTGLWSYKFIKISKLPILPIPKPFKCCFDSKGFIWKATDSLSFRLFLMEFLITFWRKKSWILVWVVKEQLTWLLLYFF